ncbi:MAG TPA: caspase family protein [Trichocoleus sp.]
MSRDALVVGINAYQKLPTLNAPAIDAEAVGQCLERFGEFRVYRMPEVIQSGHAAVGQKGGVTTRQLEEGLIRLFKPAGKNVPQAAVFYYSGHGLQRNVGIREGYLATSDADPDRGHYGLSMFWLRRLLQESPVRQRIIWLDCCHSGELLNFLEADPGAKEGTDRLFMAASREYEPAYESLEGSHSVFTKALLSGLNPYQARQGTVSGHHLMEVVSSELKGEIQQPLFESSGSDIILARYSGVAPAVSTSAATTLDRLKQLSYSFCPYRGLNPFEESHAPYFFGREKFTAQLTQYVENSPFCAVVGASGTGKTSVLQAGLIPSLKQQSALAEAISWDIRKILPEGNPLQRLAEAFINPKAEGVERASQLRQAETFLKAGGQGLAQLVRASLNGNLAASCAPTKRLLLVIDQFELALSPLSKQASELLDSLAIERSHFIHCLTEVLRDHNLPVHVVIGLRSDRIESLRQYPDFYALVTEHALVVPSMAYEEIKAAVLKPLEKIGLRYDPNLIYTLMLDLVGAPGELPLLQLALHAMWQRREKDPTGQEAPKLTLEAYTELGGVRNMLNRRATEVFQSLSAAEQEAAKRIFLSVCELGEGTEDSRRRACISELMSPAVPTPLIEQTLNKLVKAHLVVVNHMLVPLAETTSSGIEIPEAAWKTPRSLKQDNPPAIANLLQRSQSTSLESSSPVPTFDIAHESLIRTWPILRQWLDENREILWLQRRLEAAALEWQRQGHPTHPEYLLTGTRLRDAQTFQQTQNHWLSSLAQQYIEVSESEAHKQQWRSQAMRLLIPVSVALGMFSSYGHYKLTQYLATSQDSKPVGTAEQQLPSEAVKTAGLRTYSFDQKIHPDQAAIPLQPMLSGNVENAIAPFLNGVRTKATLDIPAAAISAVEAAMPTTLASTPYMRDVNQSQNLGAKLDQAQVIVIWCAQEASGPVCTTSLSQ